MELETIFPSKYLKASDLKGHEVTVVIAKAEVEKLGEDNKLVLYFQHKEKGLVTNRTNADRIAYLYGTNTDGWVGKEVSLYVDLVSFQGRTVEAVRIKPPAKRGAAPPHHVVTKRPGFEVSTTTSPDEPPVPSFPNDEIPF